MAAKARDENARLAARVAAREAAAALAVAAAPAPAKPRGKPARGGDETRGPGRKGPSSRD